MVNRHDSWAMGFDLGVDPETSKHIPHRSLSGSGFPSKKINQIIDSHDCSWRKSLCSARTLLLWSATVGRIELRILKHIESRLSWKIWHGFWDSFRTWGSIRILQPGETLIPSDISRKPTKITPNARQSCPVNWRVAKTTQFPRVSFGQSQSSNPSFNPILCHQNPTIQCETWIFVAKPQVPMDINHESQDIPSFGQRWQSFNGQILSRERQSGGTPFLGLYTPSRLRWQATDWPWLACADSAFHGWSCSHMNDEWCCCKGVASNQRCQADTYIYIHITDINIS